MKRNLRNVLILSVFTIANIFIYIYVSGSSVYFWKASTEPHKLQDLNIRHHYISQSKVHENKIPNKTENEDQNIYSGSKHVEPGPIYKLNPQKVDSNEMKKQQLETLEVNNVALLNKNENNENKEKAIAGEAVKVNHVVEVNNVVHVNHVVEAKPMEQNQLKPIEGKEHVVVDPLKPIVKGNEAVAVEPIKPVAGGNVAVKPFEPVAGGYEAVAVEPIKPVVGGNVAVKPFEPVAGGNVPIAGSKAAFQVDPELLALSHGKHIFPHNFNLVMNHPETCHNPDGTPKDTYLVVLICTIHKNFEQRKAIRETWASYTEVNGKNIKTIFLLAKNEDKNLQAMVEEEDKQYKDLIMEDFHDTYKNLTLKTMMGMKWASMYCGNAKYVMKTDDDMYVSYPNIVKYLSSHPDTQKGLAMGFLINGSPIRDPKSKWYMPKEIYPGSKYPPFLSGTGYVMSSDVVRRTFIASVDTPFLYLEDVYCATVWDKIGVKPKRHADFHNWRTAYSFCRYKRILTTHMVPPSEMRRIWNDQKTRKTKCSW